jgi:hemolysin D
MLVFTTAAAWSVFGTVDIVAVAPGRIVVNERTKQIQPLERSVIKSILVSDGEHVRAGQALMELDPTAASADRVSVDEQLDASTSDLLRSRTLLQALDSSDRRRERWSIEFRRALPVRWSAPEMSAAVAQFDAERSDIIAKIAHFDAELVHRQAERATALQMAAKLETTLPMLKKREDDFMQLAGQGFVAAHAGEDRRRERIELERDLATQRAKLAEADSALQESENAKTSYLAETRRSLRDREAQADLKMRQSQQDEAKAIFREKLTSLKSPVDGTVQQLAVHTLGGVVTEAQVLMVIVPESAQVVAEVMLENKDIGFVRTGQTAVIKLETFPYTRYGTLEGRVITVTADAVNDDKRGAIFPATISLPRPQIHVDGRWIQVAPGMNVTAEIRTGERRVIEYLLAPLQRASREGLREQ